MKEKEIEYIIRLRNNEDRTKMLVQRKQEIGGSERKNIKMERKKYLKK